MTLATSVAFDLTFLIHVTSAVATIIILVTMRYAAAAVGRGADSSLQARYFPGRRNWAARFIHLLALSGLVLALSGGPSDSLSRPWVAVGLLCYLAAAGHLEFRVLPEERRVGATIRRDGRAPAALGRALGRSVDTVLVLVAIALLSMLIQY